jgi:hypothetical protein
MSRLFAATLLWVAVVACGAGDTDDAAGSTGTDATGSVAPAPELVEISEWLNSEPLTLARLRGSPVLLVFWRDT